MRHTSETSWSALVIDHVLARPRRVFVVAFVLVFLSIAAWSLATPLYASPDEPAHVVHAVALDEGQLIGSPIGGASSPFTEVTVPASIAESSSHLCFAFKISVPASCARAFTSSTKSVETDTSAGRYPPLYYAIVGLPSIVSTSTTGVYLMRLVSAAISALFVALAFLSVCLWSRRSLMLVGVLLAATPMTLFLAGVVNPNGMEIFAALCLWTSGSILVLEHIESPPPGLLAVVTASAVVLMLSRGISPLWVVLISLVFAILAGRRNVVALLRNRAVWLSLAVVAAAAVVAISWILVVHANDLRSGGVTFPHEGTARLLLSIWSLTGSWIEQMIGVFGWLDTPAPLFTYLVWYALVGVVLLLALVTARAREIASLTILVALVLLVPVAISYNQAHHLQDFWQGRYILPLATGVPVLAMALFDGSGILTAIRSRFTWLMCIAIGLADFAAFYTMQRRYATGLPGPLYTGNGSWGPPLGNVGMALWYLVATGLLVGFAAMLASRAQDLNVVGKEGVGEPRQGPLRRPSSASRNTPADHTRERHDTRGSSGTTVRDRAQPTQTPMP